MKSLKHFLCGLFVHHCFHFIGYRKVPTQTTCSQCERFKDVAAYACGRCGLERLWPRFENME